MVRLQRGLHYEDLDKGFVEVLEDLEEVLAQSSKIWWRSWWNPPWEILAWKSWRCPVLDVLSMKALMGVIRRFLYQDLVRSSLGGPGMKILESSWRLAWSCTGPCEQILLRPFWNLLGGQGMIWRGPGAILQEVLACLAHVLWDVPLGCSLEVLVWRSCKILWEFLLWRSSEILIDVLIRYEVLAWGPNEKR